MADTFNMLSAPSGYFVVTEKNNWSWKNYSNFVSNCTFILSLISSSMDYIKD